jgi:hydroxymethylpyrimidine/phosphomethylpyrimidine kinase
MTTHPIALTIAGSDSGGGAGIQADLKAFSALGVFGTSAITAVTAQNTVAVTDVLEIPAQTVASQIRAVLDDMDVRAIKIGMLFSPAIITAVADILATVDIPVVLDPVMIAKSGDALLMPSAVSAMQNTIFAHADLLTPNLPEAAALLNTPEATTIDDMHDQAAALMALGPKAVLMKGGHGRGDTCTDVLVWADGSLTFDAPRVNTKNTHGTGCTYSASIAAHLAHGMSMQDAVGAAHGYLQHAIIAADQLNVGAGHGPVHHFHAVWS